MNKLEFISALKKEAGLTKTEAARIVELFFDEMKDTLAPAERVEIRGLCSFYVKKYKNYTGRNPKKGKTGQFNFHFLEMIRWISSATAGTLEK